MEKIIKIESEDNRIPDMLHVLITKKNGPNTANSLILLLRIIKNIYSRKRIFTAGIVPKNSMRLKHLKSIVNI